MLQVGTGDGSSRVREQAVILLKDLTKLASRDKFIGQTQIFAMACILFKKTNVSREPELFSFEGFGEKDTSSNKIRPKTGNRFRGGIFVIKPTPTYRAFISEEITYT